MNFRLPPRDPHESAEAHGLQLELAEPTVWFVNGPPTPEAQRFAQLMLEHRPGALLVYDTR